MAQILLVILMSRPAPYLKIVPNQSVAPVRPNIDRNSIGRILLSRNWVTESDLLKAQSIQRVEAARIGEILVAMGRITIDQLYGALAMLHKLDLVDLQTLPPSTNWTEFSDVKTALQQGFIVWRSSSHNLTIAITDPNSMQAIRKRFRHQKRSIDFILVKPSCLQKFIADNQGKYLQEQAVICCPEAMTCRSWALWSRLKLWGLIAMTTLASLAIYAPVAALSAALSLILVTLILLMGFRITCILALQKQKGANIDPPPRKLVKRPKVSLLVPLFRETAILDRLVSRLDAIAYPKELLEICFIHEENDPQTKAALDALDMPWYMKTVEVPAGQLQTKPRAMNYALDFCSGSIIGIYDAEDAPEVSQVEQVVQKFAVSDEKIACIQCVLDFYNTNTNWLARCFTVEYAILFRIILPALDILKMPIPLGGTSVFFRREVLEKLGRWDAYNVTEDADLGFRLYRMGYRCAWINTVTYEEANYRLIPWVKQRSRWLKGFFLTALVHFKNPVKLHKEVGTRAVLSMLTSTIIPWVICPLAPIILPMWLLSFGFDLPLYSELPKWFTNTLVVTFIATEIMSLYLGFKATATAQHNHLKPWILTTIFYWPIASLASYKALFEIIVRPAYWDKSEHGLNDGLYTDEIEILTHNTGHDTSALNRV
jgi:cellulose synthase/poly-beta-1,6-N-acetylglucosamine synthase-like glycosyltransferase